MSRSPRVLVLDDDPLGAAILAAVLEDEGFVVEHLEDPRAALDRWPAAPPLDVLLLDRHLGALDALLVVSSFREARATGSIVLVSGSRDAVPDTLDGAFVKGDDPELLVALLRELTR